MPPATNTKSPTLDAVASLLREGRAKRVVALVGAGVLLGVVAAVVRSGHRVLESLDLIDSSS